MKITQTRRFEKQVKRFNKKQKIDLDTTIRLIISDPESGDPKKGDLSGVYIYKFKIQSQLYLLAYTYTEEEMTLLMIGPHENFYRDLKK